MRGRMRALERNKSTFYYALRDWDTEQTDAFGNQEIVYHPFVKMRAHISPASGTTAIEQFGYNIRYDKVIVTTDMDCPIDEDTVLLIDNIADVFRNAGLLVDDDNLAVEQGDLDINEAIAMSEDGEVYYDYVVKRVSKSLNNISYAVEKVKVS